MAELPGTRAVFPRDFLQTKPAKAPGEPRQLQLRQVMDAFIAFEAHRKGSRQLSRADGFLIDEEEAPSSERPQPLGGASGMRDVERSSCWVPKN